MLNFVALGHSQIGSAVLPYHHEQKSFLDP